MFATFNVNSCTTIVSCYSPINVSDETNIIFYKMLSSLARLIHKDSVLIIGRDISAQIGKDENNEFCLHNLQNKKGEYQADISLEINLPCLNAKFLKRDGNL